MGHLSQNWDPGAPFWEKRGSLTAPPHPKQGCLAEFINAPFITCPSGPRS